MAAVAGGAASPCKYKYRQVELAKKNSLVPFMVRRRERTYESLRTCTRAEKVRNSPFRPLLNFFV